MSSRRCSARSRRRDRRGPWRWTACACGRSSTSRRRPDDERAGWRSGGGGFAEEGERGALAQARSRDLELDLCEAALHLGEQDRAGGEGARAAGGDAVLLGHVGGRQLAQDAKRLAELARAERARARQLAERSRAAADRERAARQRRDEPVERRARLVPRLRDRLLPRR